MGTYTSFAGLYQPEPGDDISANNYQFYQNVGVIDQLLQQAMTRRYDGVEAVQAFASGATLVAVASGGALPAGSTFWIGITAIDAYNGETVVALASATVPGGVTDPTSAPALTAINDGGGEMTAGTYRYGYTVIADGGESEVSPIGEVSILTNGQVVVTPPASIVSNYDWRLYRSFGYSDLSRVGGTFASGTVSVTDNGIDYSVFYDQQPPDENLTGETGMIQITRPAMPVNAVGWKVYAGGDPTLPSPSLLTDLDAGEVNDVIDDSVAAVLFVDITQISAGSPPRVSRTIDGGDNVAAANVDYGGSGAVGSGGLASGAVEDALDALVGRTARMVNSVNEVTGAVSIVGSGTVAVASAGSTITITGTGGGASTYLSASGDLMTGTVYFVGASGAVVRQVTSASSIIIEGTTVRASGQTGVSGDVQLVGGSGISLDQSGSAITVHSTLVQTTVRESGDTPLMGDIQIAGGTGITVTQNSAGSALTISATGTGPASAGVNSIQLDGEAGTVDGDIVLYEGAGINITQEVDGFTFAATASPTVLIASGSAYAPSAHVYAGSGMTMTAEASGITLAASGHARLFAHTFAIGGDVAVASGDTDYIPGFWVPVGPKQTIKVKSIQTKLNGATGAIASASVLRNGVAIVGLDDIHITTSSANDTPTSPPSVSDMDSFHLRIDLVSGSPKNLSATLVFEETIIP